MLEFEDGCPLPRRRSVTAQPVHVGYLTLTDQYDNQFRRTIIYPMLRSASTDSEVLPRLRNVVVRGLSDGSITVGGFEIDEATRICKGKRGLSSSLPAISTNEPRFVHSRTLFET